MNPMKWGASALVLWALVGTEAGAQTRPPSGLPGQLPAPAVTTPPIKILGRPDRPMELEDLIPADPLQLWHVQLLKEKAGLSLTAEQVPAFDTFARELDDVQRMNAQRVRRAMRRQPSATSAVTDVERDLRTESADAADWASALNDLSQRWRALQKALSADQRARIDRLYQQSLLNSRESPH